jgi:hypothetical protein
LPIMARRQQAAANSVGRSGQPAKQGFPGQVHLEPALRGQPRAGFSRGPLTSQLVKYMIIKYLMMKRCAHVFGHLDIP